MTTPKVARVKKLIAKGYSQTRIAEELQVTRQDISQLCLRHGLKPPSGYRAMSITEEQIKAFINEGKTNKEMAEILGVSESSISKKRREFKLSGSSGKKVSIKD